MVSAAVATEGNQPSFRKSFLLKDKRDFVHAIDSIVKALENSATFVPYKTNGNAHKIHPGPPSILYTIKQDLSRFVFEMRQRGIQVSTRMIHQEACHLLPNFRGKSIIAKNSVILCFIKSIGLSNRAATHTAQKHFQDTKQESKHFIEFMKAKLLGKIHVISSTWTQPPFCTLFTPTRCLRTREQGRFMFGFDNGHEVSYTRCHR